MNKQKLTWGLVWIYFLIFIPSSLHSSPQGPPISTIHIQLYSQHLTEEEARTLIPLKEGDPYSPERLEEVKRALLETSLFEHVTAQATLDQGKVIVTLDLVEGKIIRKIKVSGHYPFLTKRILRLISLQAGDAYHEENLEENERRIIDFFESRGHYGTTVTIQISQDKKYPSAVNLNIHINKGKTYSLGNIIFSGNHFFSGFQLKNKLFSFTHFSEQKIKKKLKKIQNKYIKKGFVRTKVQLKEVKINPDTKRIDITVEISEKQRLRLNFAGNSWFSRQTLEDEVTFYKERGYNRFEVERSKEKLIDFYKINGFYEVIINTEIDSSPEDEVIVTFLIDEGPRVRTKEIAFEGNRSLSKKKLTKVMSLEEYTITQQGFYRPDTLEEDLQNIQLTYQNNGFFDATIKSWDVVPNWFGDRMTVKINIDEGLPYIVDSIQFKGNNAFKSSFLYKKSGLKIRKPYNDAKVLKALDKLRNIYQDGGYPYIEITVDREPELKNHSIKIIFTVTEGPKTFVRKIIVTGNFHTKEKTILNTLKFKNGEPYSYKKLLSAQLNLKRLGIFDYVYITPVGIDEKISEVDIIVKVAERKKTTLDTEAGFDSDKLGSGQIVLTQRNLFGLAKQIQLRAIGGFELNRGEINFFSPRLFGASWNLINQYFAQHEDRTNFNAYSYGGSVGVLKQFGSDWTLLLKTQVSRFNIDESTSNQEALEDNLADNTLLEIILSGAYDNRDNFIDPERGIYTLLTTEFDTDLANASNNFNRTFFNISHYYGFLKRLTLINTLRTAKIFNISNDPNISAPKLFFLGGNDTVRGFDEEAINPSGGKTSIIYNAELHFRIIGAFKLAGFFDTGSLTNELTDISTDTFRESAGVGLRYITPVGPIRLDYGFVLDARPGEQKRRLHFSFGYFF